MKSQTLLFSVPPASSVASAAPWALPEHSRQDKGRSQGRSTGRLASQSCWPGLGHMALPAERESGKLGSELAGLCMEVRN